MNTCGDVFAVAEWNTNCKATSSSDRAFHFEVAAHQPAECLTERQAQSGAAIFTCARIVDDREFLENARDSVRTYSDAGIDDVDHQFIGAVARLAFCNKFNPAVLGKLHGVIYQLCEHISKFAAIAEWISDIGVDFAGNRTSVFRRGRLCFTRNLIEQISQSSFL